MPEPFSLSVCALKTVAAVSSILAAGDKDVSFESVALAVEGLVKGGEAVKAFRERDQKIFAATLNATAKKLEALYQDLLRHSHSAGFRESVEVAFANLSEVIARCLPTGEALARMNHDPETIAAAVVDAALEETNGGIRGPSRRGAQNPRSSGQRDLFRSAGRRQIHGRAAGRELGGSAFAP